MSDYLVVIFAILCFLLGYNMGKGSGYKEIFKILSDTYNVDKKD